MFSKGTGLKRKDASNGEVVVLRPFSRLIVDCSVPRFDPEIFAYDCVCLMQYDDAPQKDQENRFDEVHGSRAYLDRQTQKEFYGNDRIKWNTSPPECKMEDIIDAAIKVIDTKGGGILQMKKLRYTPIMCNPGRYTVRLCLDDLQCDPPVGLRGNSYRTKMALSAKSYYRNLSNWVTILVEDRNALAWAESFSSELNDGDDGDDDDDDDDSGKQSATGSKVKADKHWRPIMETISPFNTKRDLVINYNEDDDDYNGYKRTILVNAGKGKAEPKRVAKVGVFPTTKNGQISGTAVCSWIVDKDGKIYSSKAKVDGKSVAMSYLITKSGRKVTLDFTKLLIAEMKTETDKNDSRKLPQTYVVCFIKASDGKPLCSSEDDPMLKVTFQDQQDDKKVSYSGVGGHLDFNDVHLKDAAGGKGEE